MNSAPINLPAPLWKEIRSCYDESHRHYHAWSHIESMLSWYYFFAAEKRWTHPREVFIAIIAHDIVYDVARSDNETLSAIWIAHRLRSHKVSVDLDLVSRLVELTAYHGSDMHDLSPEEMLFLDIDMAILSAPTKDYDHFERSVETEYEAVYGSAYRIGRIVFLRKLLALSKIYRSKPFSYFEQAARENITRYVSLLANQSAHGN